MNLIYWSYQWYEQPESWGAMIRQEIADSNIL